jgi:hypothetical protein
VFGVWNLETERAFSGSVPVFRDETILKNILLSFSGEAEISRPLLTSFKTPRRKASTMGGKGVMSLPLWSVL